MTVFLESFDRPLKGAVAGEDILVGLLVEHQGDGTVEVVDDTSTRIDGIADVNERGGYISEEWDDTTDYTYKAAADNYLDRLVRYGGFEDGARIRCRTALDPADAGDTIALEDGVVVGVAQSTDADYHGRIVQEGFADGQATPVTYSRANDNFLPVGVVYQDESTSFDDLVRVEVKKDL